MPDANEKKKLGICPNCQSALHYLESKQALPPFWQILPQFFLFPCHKDPLQVLALSGLLALSYLGHYLLALAATLMILALTTCYGYQVINKKNLSLKSPPGLSDIASIKNVRNSLFVSAFIGLTLLTPVLLAYYTNLFLAIGLGTVLLGILPTIIMVKFRQEKFNNALTIDSVIAPITQMKWAYLGLMIGTLVAYIASLVLVDFSHQHLQPLASPMVTPVIGAIAFSYFSLVLFSALAYILNEYQSFHSPTLKPSQSRTKTKKVKPQHDTDNAIRIDADIDIALKLGNYAELVAYLEGELKRQHFSDLRRDQLYKLLVALNDHPGLEKYAHSFLSVMLARNDIDDAVQFIQTLLEHNTEFVLYDLALSKQLADTFHTHNEHQLVAWLAHNAHTRFDPEPALAELYLRAAKTLLTKLHDKNKASEYLSYIIAHFPDLATSESAKILLKLIHKSYPNP